MKRKLLASFLTLCLLSSIISASSVAAFVDTTAPVVKSVSMTTPGAEVAVGATLFFDVELDDASDISAVTLAFKAVDNPDNLSVLYARLDSYNVDSGIAQSKLEITESIPKGNWSLDHIIAEDDYGNRSVSAKYNTQGIDFDNCHFIVTDAAEDIEAPIAKAVNLLNETVSVTVGDILRFQVEIDDDSLISEVTLAFKLDGESNNLNVLYARLASYDQGTGIAQAELKITEKTPSAMWTLDHIIVEDCYGNRSLSADYNSDIIDFASCYFIVTDTPTDTKAPVITAVNLMNGSPVCTAGDVLKFNVEIDDASIISYVSLAFKLDGEPDNLNTLYARISSYNYETRIAQAELTITDTIPSAKWVLNHIIAEDCYGNRSVTADYNTDEIDFDICFFWVASDQVLPESIQIPEQVTVSVRDVYTIRPTFSPINSIPKWTWTSSDVEIAEVVSSGGGTGANVTGVSPGTATITATTSNGLIDTCEVTVTDAPLPTEIEIESTYSIGIDESLDIVPTLTPNDATTLFEITTDNPHIVDVATTGGHTGLRIRGVNAGTATVTIRTSNNLIVTAEIIVGTSEDLQHKKVTIPEVTPTCTEPGRTEYIKCSACSYVYTKPQGIPATGHNWDNGIVQVIPTCIESGVRKFTCSQCTGTKTEPISAVGHVMVKTEAKAPTYSAAGNNEYYTCSTCQRVFKDEAGQTETTVGAETIPQLVQSSSGGSSSSSGNSNTTTIKNPDGSTTATTTDKKTGTVTEVTQGKDGSTFTVETKKDGTVTETVKTPAGTTGTVITGGNGDVTEVKASVSNKAISEANNAGEAVTLPVETPVAVSIKDAPAVEVTLPKNSGAVKVVIPVEKISPGIVAVIVYDDGTEKIVPTSTVTENGVMLTLSSSSTVKVIDNAKRFSDVPATNVFYNEICTLSARNIMIGVSNDKFNLNGTVTLDQIANVAGRISGAVDVKDYTAGIAWGQTNGLESGSSAATRGDVLRALYIAADSPAVENTSILTMFTDDIPDDMKVIAAWAAQNGVLKGSIGAKANLTANLGANVTRGQACALAGRTLNAIR